jgi:hypothetical protein
MPLTLDALFSHHIDLCSPGVSSLPTHGGVYLIADADDRPVLLSACEDLRRVVTARLAAPTPGQRTRRTQLAEIAARVYWTPTFSPFHAALRYHAVSRVIHPETYRQSLAFGPAWFLRGDPGEAIPRITVARDLHNDRARFVGPFARRRDAEETLHVLEDLFDLCRKYDILRQAPRGQPCEYLDMGRCPAPCDGRYPMTAYREALGRALGFAAGDREPWLDELRNRMRQAAAAQQYEQAASLRQRIDRAASHFNRPECRLVRDFADFRWLVLQRGGPRTRSEKRLMVQPFFATPSGVEEGQPVPLADVPTRALDWYERLRPRGTGVSPVEHGTDAADRSDPVVRTEQVWLVCHYLFKGDAAPGLFPHAYDLPGIDALVEAIRSRLLLQAMARGARNDEIPAAPSEDVGR